MRSQSVVILFDDLLQPSSLQVAQSVIAIPAFLALASIVLQTSVFPPSSWQPRKTTSLSCSRIYLFLNKFSCFAWHKPNVSFGLTIFGDYFLTHHRNANLSRLKKIYSRKFFKPITYAVSYDWWLAILLRKKKNETFAYKYKVKAKKTRIWCRSE